MQKNKNRPGYKKTKVGWIPKDWDVVTLNDCVRNDAPICYGILMPGEHTPGGVPVIKVTNIRNGELHPDLLLHTTYKIEKAYSRSRLDSGDILLSIRGSTGDVAIVPDCLNGANITQDTARVRTNAGVGRDYVQFALSGPILQRQIRTHTIGQAVKGINIGEVRKLKIPLPSLPEQKAIAEVLGCWDKAIRGYERRIEKKRNIKKGLMQRLLSSKQRLPGFGGEWKEVQLGKVCRRVTCKNTGDCSNLLTISGPMGLANQEEYFKRRIAATDTSGYYLLKRGQYAYNRSTCNGYPYGAIKRLNDYEAGVVSTLYLCFEPKPGVVESNFLEFYFEGGCLNRELFKIVAEGARSHGLLNVAVADFFKTRLLLPVRPEQQAIAAVLSSADAEIAALDRKLTALRQQKRFLLNNMVTGTIRLPRFVRSDAGKVTAGDPE